MQFTTIITFLLVALLLFGCTAQKAEEKTSITAVKNETTTKNETAKEENIPNAAIQNETSINESNIANSTTVANNATTKETNTSGATAQETNVSQNASAAGIPVAYFYSLICPFCKNASIYIEGLEKKYPVSVQKYEIYYNETNFNLFKQYVAEYRLKPDEFSVPTVFINASYYGGPNIYDGLEKKIQNLTKETKK